MSWLSWFDDLDRRVFRAFARGRTRSEQQATVARRWWALLLAGVVTPAAYAAAAVALGVFFWWQLVLLLVFMTMPMAFSAGYLYAERLRQQGVAGPWWVASAPPPREEVGRP